ncbi:MAG: SpoIIE family protein phosphatase [Leptospiraceae bacterium]|nr:SpoIIE family protein phosphatase [Leptospiraceae bacterium]
MNDKRKLVFTKAFGVLIILFLLGLLTGLAYNDRQQIKENGIEKVFRLTDLITKEQEKNFIRIETMLTSIDYAISAHPESSSPFSEKIHDMLLGIKSQNKYLLDITVIHPRIEIIHWTATGKVPNIKDRDFAITHLKDNSTSFFVGEPKLSRVHKGKWFIGVSYASRTKDGTLIRIISAMIDLEYLENYLTQIPKDEYTKIEIVKRSGSYLARVPSSAAEMGTEIIGIEEFQKDNQSVSFKIEAESTLVGIQKGYNNQIIILVTLSNSQAYPYWNERIITYYSLGLIIFIIFSFGFYKISSIQLELMSVLALIRSDLKVAKRIQKNILSTSSIKFNGITIDMNYLPMLEVGGDIYDIHHLGKGIIRVFIADATGHGIQAALMTMSIFSEYQNVREFELSPSEILSILNRNYYRRYFSLNSYFTCIILDIDMNLNKLTYSSAGHPNQIMIQSGRTIVMKSKGKLMGVLMEAKYEDLIIEGFNKDDRLILFTDGLFEEFNLKNEEYGEERIFNCIKKNNHKTSSELINEIMLDVNLHRGQVEQSDDITLLIIQKLI